MKNYECWKLGEYLLEFFDDTHTYLVNGVIIPSITQILKIKFGKKYDGISAETLNNASKKGNELHKAIEEYEKYKKDSDLLELRNYKFIKNAYKFDCIDNEVPIILFMDEKPVAVGRLDLVLKLGDDIGLGDIKRTSVLDKEYLGYQLNLYKIGYEQTYNIKINFLKGLHLRENVRKLIDIPINKDISLNLINEYLNKNKK